MNIAASASLAFSLIRKWTGLPRERPVAAPCGAAAGSPLGPAFKDEVQDTGPVAAPCGAPGSPLGPAFNDQVQDTGP